MTGNSSQTDEEKTGRNEEQHEELGQELFPRALSRRSAAYQIPAASAVDLRGSAPPYIMPSFTMID